MKGTSPHAFQVGDRVIFTNDFGVCWGVKTITELDTRCGRPTYHYEPNDTPWYSTDQRNLKLADTEDAGLDWGGLQAKHGFKPTLEQLGGCY